MSLNFFLFISVKNSLDSVLKLRKIILFIGSCNKYSQSNNYTYKTTPILCAENTSLNKINKQK